MISCAQRRRSAADAVVTRKEHTVLEAALRHVFERRSVVREGDVLNAALELHPDFYRWRELRLALEEHPDAIRHEGQLTLRLIRREELAAVERVREGRNQRFELGDAKQLPATLTPGQRMAAQAILASSRFHERAGRRRGTGKTTVLTAIEGAHVAAGGQRFVALAPQREPATHWRRADLRERTRCSDSWSAKRCKWGRWASRACR